MLAILSLTACHVTTPEPPAPPVAPPVAPPRVTAVAPSLPAPPVTVPQLAMGANDDIPPDTIHGQVIDASDGAPIAGVTVIVTSPMLEHAQAVITDENGEYQVGELPVGNYLVTYYYADLTVERPDIAVIDDRATPMFVELDTSPHHYAPESDPASISQGITIDSVRTYTDIEYVHYPGTETGIVWNIPVPGRTFDAALGAAAGSQGDSIGVSFSGGTSLENTYVIDNDESSIDNEYAVAE